MGVPGHHSSSREVDESWFIDALIFAWLLSGTDAHAKIFGLLIASGGRERLAPLFDLSSALAYPKQVHPRDATLVMKIGNQYKLCRIGLREWQKCATALRHDEDAVRARILDLAAGLPDAAAVVHKEMRAAGIRHGVTQRLVTAMRERAAACAKMVA